MVTPSPVEQISMEAPRPTGGRWSRTPLRTKGLLVALLPAIPIIVLWLLILGALLRSPSAGPSPAAQTRDVHTNLLKLRVAIADARIATYSGESSATATAEIETLLASVHAVITDPAGQQAQAAVAEAVKRHLDVLRTLGPSADSEVRQADLPAYVSAVAAIRALDAQRDQWLATATSPNQARSRWFFVGFFALSVLTVVGGLWFAVRLIRSITRRIEQLVAGADAVVQAQEPAIGDLGNDEIGELGRRLGQMLHILQDRDRTVQHRNAELAAVNDELESFSYAVSHDLRAPLRAISGFSQILKTDNAANLDEGGQDALQRILAATSRMGVLIDQLLNLSRLSRTQLVRRTIAVSALSREIVAALREAEPGRSVDVEVGPDIEVLGDPGLLRIAFENLIGNAWKYTGRAPQPRIAIACTPGRESTAVHIKDNGAGFDMAHANMLFGAFQRLHAQRDFPGVGIGLATVQRIVHRHGGRITGEGVVGEGATFTVVLPKIQ